MQAKSIVKKEKFTTGGKFYPFPPCIGVIFLL